MLLRLILAVLGGLALAAAFAPLALAPLVIIGLALFALVTVDLRFWRAGFVGLVFGVAFYFTHIHWMSQSVGTDAWLALASVEALFYGVIGLAAALVRRLPGWPVWLAAVWTSIEALRSVWPFSGMPWGRISFATVDTPVAGAAAYVGLPGVSFLLALSAFFLAAWLSRWLPGGAGPATGPLRRPLLLAGAVGALALLVVPTVRPFEVHESGEAVVAAVQGDVPGPGNDILWDHRQVTRNHADATRDLAAAVAEGSQPRPDFVLWPENSTAVDPFSDAGVTAEVRDAVAAIGVPVLVGALVEDGQDHILNQGIVWDPETGPGDRYTKRHPVAYGEYIPYRSLWDPEFGRLDEIGRDMKTGTRTDPLTIADIPVADAICFDIAYDEVMRDQVAAGAELLTVQTSNTMFIFTDQIEQQFAITRLRAIETGRWLVVASPNGRTGIISSDGTVVAAADRRTTEVLVERVGLSTTLTPAVRLGAWPVRSLGGVSVLTVLVGAISYRRSRRRLQAPGVDTESVPAGQPARRRENADDEPSEEPVG